MPLMHLKVLLPFEILVDKSGVSRIVAETSEGSFGILPRRLDCVAALRPGILIFQSENEGESYLAVNEGVLVKAGFDVLVSVRDAVAGTDLAKLRETVDRKYLTVSAQEQNVRSVMSKMTSSFISRLAEFQHG